MKRFKVLRIFVVSIIIVVLIISGILFFFGPLILPQFFVEPQVIAEPQIVVEPQKLDVPISRGKNFTKTISIRANEKGYVNLTLNAIEPMYKWVKISNKSVPVEAGRTYYVNVKFVIPSNATPGEYKGAIEITHNCSARLFSWGNVPGKDSERLRRLSSDYLSIGWVGDAKISKSDDGKTINIFKDKNSAEIMIDEKKEKATLKISDGYTRNLKVKKENGKLNIYCSVKAKIPVFIKIEQTMVKL